MEAASPPAVGTADYYPVRFEIEYPERLSRWKVLLKWLFAIPQFIVIYLLQIVLGVMALIAFFTILFTGRYPRGLFDFVAGAIRWTLRVDNYARWLMTDRYPPFSLE